MPKSVPAKLILADGTEFVGRSFGAPVSTSGEVVFNTSMVGYPEAFTDPSYHGQVLVMTYPIVGNYGVPAGPFESDGIKIEALIVQYYSEEYSHADATQSLGDWLTSEGIPAIAGIDTRAVTKKLREHGVMLGQIVVGNDAPQKTIADPNARNLVAEVSIAKPKVYGKGKKTVLAVDCGMKENILRNLVSRGLRVKRVPWDYDFTAEDWDGLFISNGPGDPVMADATIRYTREALKLNKPIFGICLGSQILGLAAGAKTYKLKYGHRSQNQPCVDLESGRSYLTTQNHGFAVRETTLPKDWEVWFRNANDDSVEGIRHRTKPYISVQFHPEHHPGPQDCEYLFDLFADLINRR
jgi:carbamoyl-phosphate synthase small subunit